MLGHSALLADPFASEAAPSLDACYRACAAITRAHSKSFALSSSFLPYHKRRAVWAVYGFCRTADDIADSDCDPGERIAAIDAWETELYAAYAGRATHPVFLAFADAAGRFDIPLQPALDLLRGIRMDIAVNRYATYGVLRDYCYLVASTVGLLVSPILGVLNSLALNEAIALGHAMQMTNILRDVGEDARMNRIYLPADEMARFGYGEDDLFAGTLDARFNALMQFQIERARRLYRDAEPGIAHLHPDGRYAVGLALRLYRGILRAIEANRYDVFSKRAYVPLGVKVSEALLLALRSR